MSLVGIFSKRRPSIGGLFFDAVLEETSELVTDVTEYPIETGAIGNDHAVTRPLRVTMTVALSDNPLKDLQAQASAKGGTLAGSAVSIGAGVGVGAVAGMMGGAGAAAFGVAGTLAMKFLPGLVGDGKLRSSGVLESIRELQRTSSIIEVIGAKETYRDMIITGSRTQVTKENEGGLELVVDMKQLVIVGNEENAEVINANLPEGDTASTQAQAFVDYGELVLV